MDAFRLVAQPERLYSWWDYGLRAFERNWGLRIDLAPRKRERPSDHAPVIVELH